MKQTLIVLILLIPNLIYTQNKIELRDLSFSVPNEFFHITKGNKLDYQNYYETGKIYTDSTKMQFPKIQYQYYEMPGFGLESSEKVLKDLNSIMTKDINPDTLIIKETKNYSLAKYSIMGKSLFELKSLGKKGLLNLQYFALPQNDKESFSNIKTIIGSIHHNQEYDFEEKGNKLEEQEIMNESAEYSKTALIILGISLAIFLGSKIIRKYI